MLRLAGAWTWDFWLADDGRSYVLEATARGRSTQARAGAALAAVLERLDAELGGDSDAVLDALHRLEAALRQQLA